MKETPDLPAVDPAILAGVVGPLGARAVRSGIDKRPAWAPWHAGANGLIGEEQADLRHHGDSDKALHHHPFDHYEDHYEAWRATMGDSLILQHPVRRLAGSSLPANNPEAVTWNGM